MSEQKTLLEETENYVKDYITKNVLPEYYYHNIQHTKAVVAAAQEIGTAYNLPATEQEALEIAAWFHDTGYSGGREKHEERSAEIAINFLLSKGYDKAHGELVKQLIMVTEMEATPNTLLEKIIKDADLSHLGQKDSMQYADLLRTEWEATEKKVYTDEEWYRLNVDFCKQLSFQTPIAKTKYQKRKLKNIERYKDLLDQLLEYKATVGELPDDGLLPTKRPTRGIETMFRVTLRNHIQLSKIADNKANIMLSINAILISLILSVLLPQFATQPKLIIPSTVLLGVCLISVVYATLSTRPKVTSGTFTEQDFMDKKTNLLFFGNFYKMPKDKFQWGMQKMMEDEDLLYNAMTTDLYFLGLVLAKKYAYLRTCYNFFMFGLITSAIVFMVTFVFFK